MGRVGGIFLGAGWSGGTLLLEGFVIGGSDAGEDGAGKEVLVRVVHVIDWVLGGFGKVMGLAEKVGIRD